jgi:hypothetical protein
MAMEMAPGKYVAKITDHKLTVASNGTEQLVFSIEVTGEVDRDNPEEIIELPTNKKRTVYESITENTVERVVKTLRKLGYKGKGFKALDKALSEASGLEFADLTDTEVPVRCEENNYQGRQSERWRLDFEGLGGTVASAPKDVADQLEAKFGNVFDEVDADYDTDRPEEEEKPRSKTKKPEPKKPEPKKPEPGKNGHQKGNENKNGTKNGTKGKKKQDEEIPF